MANNKLDRINAEIEKTRERITEQRHAFRRRYSRHERCTR